MKGNLAKHGTGLMMHNGLLSSAREINYDGLDCHLMTKIESKYILNRICEQSQAKKSSICVSFWLPHSRLRSAQATTL